MTQATSGRRGQGEDSIYWDASKNRYVGAVSLGFSPSGTRIRKKVAGRTKTEVRDKLKELHRQVETGLGGPVGPDRVQDGQVISIGQGLLPGLRGQPT